MRITSQRQPRIRLRAAWSWLWLVVLSLPADAQTLDPAVEAMLREGIAHRVAGRDEAAVERFEAAYRALRAPITAGQLALACQAAGRWVDADRYMREALAAPNDGWVRRRRRELDEAYAVTQRNVGELELRGGPDGATVRVEGATVGTLPLTTPLRLRAGTVTVDVRADGYLPCTRQVTILGGELTREPLAMTAVPAPPAAVVAVPSPAAAVAPLASLVVPQPVAAPRGARGGAGDDLGARRRWRRAPRRRRCVHRAARVGGVALQRRLRQARRGAPGDAERGLPRRARNR